ncbi:uncharacterized protein L3040_007381 [Drepanopeziza brunnea f. sp. 'multigermtubi']|uniref:uncharacterized protein n=1 Tax=Drepanopeziza brunnea f. sp. 'multigermtubi' TaxID=698441 RepID=UPI0023A01BA9|nr:hypothetical protein L3040_007381 [Drepanopeziza brunnea f. sp. 'multigermtubi']
MQVSGVEGSLLFIEDYCIVRLVKRFLALVFPNGTFFRLLPCVGEASPSYYHIPVNIETSPAAIQVVDSKLAAWPLQTYIVVVLVVQTSFSLSRQQRLGQGNKRQPQRYDDDTCGSVTMSHLPVEFEGLVSRIHGRVPSEQ